ncbi:MAG: Ig-like domain-containing protein [Acholeplasmatales bacterium]|nr:Ig-like domain-containing protein [Acholeplasmatales bacterium]
MKKKKIIFSLLGLGLAAVTLASCGEKNNDDKKDVTSDVINTSSDTSTSTNTDTSTTTSQGGGVISTTTSQGGGVISTTSSQGDVTTSTSTQTSTTTSEVIENVFVSFNSNGSTTTYPDFEVGQDGKVTKPETDPKLVDDENYSYKFMCWCKDEALTVAFDFENDIVKKSTTLYAKYSKVSKDTVIKMNGVEYATIKAALEAIPTSGDTSTYTITIPKGEYHEDGLAYHGTATVRIKGNSDTKYGSDVVIIGKGSDMTQSRTRNLMSFYGSGNVILENITLISTWGRAAATAAGLDGSTQAEVLGTGGTGNVACYNCSFKSHQDTLRTVAKAWFYGCYIEGDTDFLWMETSGKVALYEKCEIVSVYDEETSTHTSYCTAPRMDITNKINKGLVIYNSTVHESDDARTKGQSTFLARTPWPSGYYNQVAYINTQVSDVQNPWSGNPIPSEFDRTDVGWKMDRATADSFNYTGSNDILSAEKVANEYNGRRSIFNRLYNVGKLKYEKDYANEWDIDALIAECGFLVDEDTSSTVAEGEVVGETTSYIFDGSVDYTSMCDGFTFQDNDGNKHYVGSKNATMTIPVSGKCYVEVYGYYEGSLTVTEEGQGESIMTFNNGNTNSQVLNTYIVFNENAKEVVLTANATTYLTKVVVTTDSSIVEKKVEGITVSKSFSKDYVGLEINLSTSITNADATNKTVKWSSSEPEVGTIDEYTGKITFIKSGTVTFTATACDGSGVTQTITCKPTNPTWNEAEWFTKDSGLQVEQNAYNISYFEVPGICESKSIGTSYSFTGISSTITTSYGMKLNSKGSLQIPTIKGSAVLTLITVGSESSTYVPTAYIDANNKAELLSHTYSDGMHTFKYRLAQTGIWTIERGNGEKENDPLIYAKVSYDAMWDFKNNFPTTLENVNFEGSSGTINCNYGSKYKLNVDATEGKFAIVKNDAGNYAQIDSGTNVKISFTSSLGVGSVLTIVACPGQSNYTVNGAEVDDLYTYTLTQEDFTKKYVELVATSTASIYSISISKVQ